MSAWHDDVLKNRLVQWVYELIGCLPADNREQLVRLFEDLVDKAEYY